MNRTGSLSNIAALIAFTALTVVLARVQPVTAIPSAVAADMNVTGWSTTNATQPLASNVMPAGRASTPTRVDDIRTQCGTSQVQYNKLAGYLRCLDEQQVSYEPAAWCPVVKTFCDAQWYPFGGREHCYTERGCPAS